MDLEAIIKAPTKDAAWLNKCVVIGLMMIIPIAGILNAMGWMKDVYRRAKAGDPTLPEANLSYIGSGWSLFVAVLPVIIVPIGFAVIGATLAITHMIRLMPLVQVINIPVSLFINLIFVPTLTYRHVVHGTGFGGAFDFAGIKKTWMTNPGAFGTFAVIYFCGSMIGGLGFIACCLGALVSFPFGIAVNANAIKAFEETSGGI